MTILDPVDLYGELHPLAELGGTEERTGNAIAKRLAALGIEHVDHVGGHGVVATLRGDEPGPVVLFRADMDALPYNDGKGGIVAIHACGHDAHCSMLLSAASQLRGKIRRGTLKLLFQPSEENRLGALSVINDKEHNVFDGVQIAIGAHIRPIQDIQPGQISPYLNHVASTTVRVNLKGVIAHGARPHLGVNPIDEAAALIMMVNSIHANPNESWSVKATRIFCEPGAENSIAAWTSVQFDVRAATNPTQQRILHTIERMAKDVADAYGGQSEFLIEGDCPGPEYDPGIVEMIKRVTAETLGEDRVAPPCGGGGEDFHYYKSFYPQLRIGYFGVGVGATPGLHSRDMHFDPVHLRDGVKMWVAIAQDLLG